MELGLELRLAHQQDLEELGRRGLEVREQSDLFQRRGAQVLRFVEDQDGVLTGPLAFDEEAVERHESLRPRLASLGDSQVLEDVLEDAVKRQRGIDHEGDRRLSVEPLTKGVKQRGLSRAHLAGQDDEAFPLLGAVEQLGQGLPVRRTHVKESGIRRRVEGLLRESVERQVHATALRSPHSAPGARDRKSTRLNSSHGYISYAV